MAKLAMLGGAVALFVNEDLRNRLLDVLFGAEEEFDYSTLTDPPAPSGPPRDPAEPFVRTSTQAPVTEAVDDSAAAQEPSTGEPASQDAEGEPAQDAEAEPLLRSIAPSPAAWRAAAAAAEEERVLASETPHEPGTRSAGPRSEPPAPPVGWWSPTKSGFDA
jgi:hypothetical protein